MDEKVELEEYWAEGQKQIIWANGVLIFCTPRGKEILDRLSKKPLQDNPLNNK